MSIKIISSGLLTTVQDLGRTGLMSTGFSTNGAMDSDSFVIANKLVMNNDSEGALEMTMLGITAEFTEDCVIAVTGADFNWKINDKELPRYCSVEIKKGDVISSSVAESGMRGYLAVGGGFDIEPVMGSYSTNLKCGIGGFEGRKLKSGDELPLRYSRDELIYRCKKSAAIPDFSSEMLEIRVVLGPQDDYFTKAGIDTFLSEVYTVTKDSDRMGIRLDGAAIEAENGVDIISDGIIHGSVQIPSSGKPIIMMADCQTTGGYAKIATVISTDLPKMAQANSKTKIKFKQVSITEAQKIYKKHRRKMNMTDYLLMF